jgi:hypothetical protein
LRDDGCTQNLRIGEILWAKEQKQRKRDQAADQDSQSLWP